MSGTSKIRQQFVTHTSFLVTAAPNLSMDGSYIIILCYILKAHVPN